MALPFINDDGAAHGSAQARRRGVPNAAGIDIGACSHWVAVPRHLAETAGEQPVREIGAMTDDLNALARWLVKLGVDTVAMESTGVYWTLCSRCWSSTG